MSRIHTETFIDAAPGHVWQHLMDWDSYSRWNPLIHMVEGRQSLGSKLLTILKLPDSKPQSFTPTVTRYEDGRVFEWTGTLWAGFLFKGRHYFELRADKGGTLFVHGEEFTGLLAAIIMVFVGDKTRNGFEEMNVAFKERCEKL